MEARLSRRDFLRIAGAGAAGLAFAGSAGADAWSRTPEYVFAVIADPHLREDREGEPTGVDKFRALLARLDGLTTHPQFALIPGDIHPEKLEPLLPEIELPLHVVAGNHESVAHRAQLRAMFPDDFGERDFYSFARGDDLFIALCTAIPGDHVGHFQSQFITPQLEQLAWLEELLARRADFRHVFVYGHVPPGPDAVAGTMFLARNDALWLQALVEQTRPTALFFGHRHTQADFEFGGVQLYGVRSCNWNSGGQPIGALVVAVFAGGFEAQFLPTEG